jgi:hypothetical protein
MFILPSSSNKCVYISVPIMDFACLLYSRIAGLGVGMLLAYPHNNFGFR